MATDSTDHISGLTVKTMRHNTVDCHRCTTNVHIIVDSYHQLLKTLGNDLTNAIVSVFVQHFPQEGHFWSTQFGTHRLHQHLPPLFRHHPLVIVPHFQHVKRLLQLPPSFKYKLTYLILREDIIEMSKVHQNETNTKT